jgi:hypothetical protein
MLVINCVYWKNKKKLIGRQKGWMLEINIVYYLNNHRYIKFCVSRSRCRTNV